MIMLPNTFKAATISFVAACTFLTARADVCKTVTDANKEMIAQYLVNVYHLDPSVRVTLLSGNIDPASCYAKLVLVAERSGQQTRTSLYLSPDRLFIMRDLHWLRRDPVQAESANAKRLYSKLIEKNPPSLGPQNAAVTVAEFSDFQCPYCRRAASILREQALAGTIRLVFHQIAIDDPLSKLVSRRTRPKGKQSASIGAA